MYIHLRMISRIIFFIAGLVLSKAWSNLGFPSYLNFRTKLQLATTVQPDAETGMKQLQILFNCDQIDPEDLSELALELGCLSVSAEVISEKPEVLNDEKRWADLVKTKCWANALLRMNVASSFDHASLIDMIRLSYPDLVFDVQFEDVMEQDWVMEVQRTWRPHIVGNLTIRFPWHIDEPVVTPHVLTLEGGAAFGTGDHPTTRLCCRWLEREVSSGYSVLDYGCGSAVLALAALRFGAGQAVGTDIDKDALISALRNARGNGLSMDLYLASDSDMEEDTENGPDISARDESSSILMNKLKGKNANEPDFQTVESIVGKEYNLVVANILAPILISLAPTISGHVEEAGGKLALSGVIKKQAETVVQAYQKHFRNVIVEEEEDDWVLITAADKFSV